MRQSILLSTSLVLVLAACSSTPSQSETPEPARRTNQAGAALRTAPYEGTRYLTAVGLPGTDAVILPDWVVNPTLDGVLGAIGVAGTNELGTGLQVDTARASARLEIARMLEVRVQEVGRRDIEQRLVASGGEVQDNGSRKSLLGVDRNIADMVLAGSRQQALWFDPGNGDCYLWMVMDGAIQAKADHYIENGVSVYVANQAVTREFRPERPKAPAPAPAASPEPEPEPVLGPIEELESRLKPIETIPVKQGSGGGK